MATVRKIKILMTGGGSGGHLYPLVAVAGELARALDERGYRADVRYFGSPGAHSHVLETAGVRITHITSSKMRTYFDVRNFFEPLRFFWGFLVALVKVFFFMPHAAFDKGGPGTLPIALACRFYRIPIVVHESDAVPGRSTRALGKAARIVELAFAEAAPHFPAGKVRVVGNPVRPDIARAPSLDPIAKAGFGFNPDQPVVLFVGGSQGAEAFNAFILEHLKPLIEKFQVLHQVGPANFEPYRKEFEFMDSNLPAEVRYRYSFAPYFEPLLRAYQAADVVVSRAGASTIFELAALGKPAILVPLPGSAHDHQTVNAYAYAKTGAAVVIEQENFLPTLVINELMRILTNPERIASMQEAAKRFATPDAARTIAGDILTVAGM